MWFVLLVLSVAMVDALPKDDLFQLVLLHNNDMHSRFEETARNSGTCKKNCIGGFARTIHRVREFRRAAKAKECPPVLFLNGGDTFVGTAWFTVHKWKICADFINKLQPDVISLGNHEFDLGIDNLASFVSNVTVPIVSSNLDFTAEPSLKAITKSVVLEVSGRKIGVIGHLTSDTQVISSPGKVKFHDMVESVRQEAERLDKQGVKIIIALGHSGYNTDMEIAEKVPEVDVVIGGHTNTFLWNGPPPDSEKPEDVYPKVVKQPGGKMVPVVQAYAYTKYLGVLNVTFNGNGDLVKYEGQPEFLDSKVPQDQDVLDLLEKYRPEIEALSRKVVGITRVVLDASNCRKAECNQGNMIADAFIYYTAMLYVGQGWTDTPIALVNGGGVRSTISQGNITRGELLGTLPFSNQLVTIKILGSELIKTLEIGARSNGETSRGEFLQHSGLHVVYNNSKPSHERVVSVKARCGKCKVPVYQDVKPDELYTVVTVSFLTQGGDGHTVLKQVAERYKSIHAMGDVDVVEDYLEKHSPVYPEEQGRIVLLTSEKTKSSGRKRVLSRLTFIVVFVYHLYTFSEVR